MTERIHREADGTKVTWQRDQLTGQVTVKETRDVEPLLNQNVRLQNDTTGWNADKSMRRVASIDPVVLKTWCDAAGIKVQDVLKNKRGYSKWLRQKVYDSDNRMFLSAPRRTTGSVRIQGLDQVITEGRKVVNNDIQ
jgi:hypothetical protein